MKPTSSEHVIVRNSPIHGRGIYAAKDIPEGTRIIEYVGEKVTKAEADRRADRDLDANEENPDNGAVYLFELNKRYDIDGNVSWNTARLINHSCDPNCETDVIRGRIWVIALKDIKKGEELSYDYNYDLDDWEDHPCRCGSRNCLGFIVGEEYRPKLRRVISGSRRGRSGKARS